MKAVNIVWDVDSPEDAEQLPTEIDIPNEIVDEEQISDYISELAGFCHKGFELRHQYSWSIDENNTMTVWEDNAVLATLEDCYSECEDCFDCTLERLFRDVVYEMRGIDLDEEDKTNE